MAIDLKGQVTGLARRRRLSVSQLVESLLEPEVRDSDGSGALPDEHAIREMAILLAVELAIKLYEASVPGGVSLSQRLLESAAQAAMARLEMVEASLEVVQD